MIDSKLGMNYDLSRKLYIEFYLVIPNVLLIIPSLKNIQII